MVGAIMVATGCNQGTEIAPLPDTAYLPLKQGRFWIYQVDSTVITANVETKYQYQLQVEVTDSIAEGAGQVWYILTRGKRANSSAPFSPLVSWSARQTPQEVVIRQGNTAFVSLAFPTISGRQWNGNAFNTLGGDDFCSGTGACDFYTYAQVGGSHQVGAISYEDVVTVEEGNTPDRLVKFDVRFSYYARHVGLIERQYTVLNYCTLPACLGRQSIDQGLRYSQLLVSYGDR